ncbi:restriction endonuclease subunit S [Chryseobacterium arthrosphaerae]|uniref:restriction endonuclease subunit S n=3 Tax=Chryseobacterium arthrosphaerae TaxID=651561 RepID=UPI001F4A2F54|nr:restriction endonuclease subunit S [Chryseobacterium arthrosphaerae]
MYIIPQNIDPNKIFITNRSNLEGRLDSAYYKNEFQIIENRFNNCEYEVVPFKKLIRAIINGFDFRNYSDDGIPYIKVANVKQGSFDFSKLQYINFNLNDLSKNIQLKKGNLLLTRKGTFGNALSLKSDYNYIISSEIFYIILNQGLIVSKYLEIFLNSNVGQKQLLRHSIGAIMGSLSQDAIKSLKIPLPPLDVQQEIINSYESAYKQKEKKESEAKELLKSIDLYLLNELGITLPEKDNTLKNRVFITQLKEVTGGRFDPKLYDKTTTSLKQAIKDIDLEKFKVEKLRTFIVQSFAGDWGIEDNEENYSQEYEKCLVIRATEFDNDFNLNLDNSRVKFRLIKKDKISKIDIQENDLLIEKSGGSPDQPVGRIAILTKDILDKNKICYSNFIHKIRINSSILNPEYLFCYLKTIHNIKLTESMQSQTNGIRNLIMQNYFNQDIVVPILPNGDFDLEKQYEIANHIQGLRAKAMLLQQEAQKILDNAKKQVEQMILGNVS